MLNILKYQYPAILWGIFVLIMCNLRIGDSITGSGFFFDGFDKLSHTGFFFVLTVFLFYGRVKQYHTYSYSFWTLTAIVMLSALFGGGIEMMQEYFSTYRSAEWWDFACDMIGCSMGVFSYICLHRMHSPELNHQPGQGNAIRNRMQISLPINEDEK